MAAIAPHHQGLRDAIAQSRKTIHEWADKQKAAADRISAAAQEEFEAFQKRMDETRANLLALQLEGKLCLDSTEKRLKLKKDIDAQRSENAKLEAVLMEKKEVVAAMIKAHSKQKEKAGKAKQNSETILRSGDEKLEDLTRGLVNYKSLGLDFEKVEGEKLRFVFTQIDENQPNRKYSFVLHVVDDLWKVSDCNPSLDPDFLASVIHTLNENEKGDVGPFVRDMRKAFQATAV